jgi:hypothetical protein
MVLPRRRKQEGVSRSRLFISYYLRFIAFVGMRFNKN